MHHVTVMLATVPLWIACLLPGLYLLGIAVVHLRRRPLAVAGSWDLALVAAAVTGLAMAGPLELIQPVAVRGAWRLVLPAVLCGLLTALAILVTRPRLVVYNVTLEQLRPVVVQVASSLDRQARWAGETVALPGRGIQVTLDGRTARCVSLAAIGGRTSPEGWAEFSRRVRRAVRVLRVRSSPWAAVFGGCGAAVVAAAVWLAVRPPAPTPEPVVPAAPAAPVPVPPAIQGACHAGPRRPFAA
jgi:hypothetical protein